MSSTLLLLVPLPNPLVLSPFFFFFLSLPHISVFSQQINTSHTELKLAGRGTTQKISIGVDNVAENVFIAMALMESHYHFTVEFPNLL